MREDRSSRDQEQAHEPLPLTVRIAVAVIGALPLSAVHVLGGLCGRLALLFFASERRRLRDHLRSAGYTQRGLARACAAEAGKTLVEVFWLWQRPQSEIVRLVRRVTGEHWVMDADRRGRGVVFLTPHLGCFEIAAQYAASFSPITVMYRPPRQRLVRVLAEAGRRRENMRLVPSNTRGATALLAALNRGEWIGLLPDQVPAADRGEWAEFFGRPAYTMTLALRLAQRSGASVVLSFCERLPRGRGYAMHLEPMPPRLPGESDVRHLNRALEHLIRRCPKQYFWSYNRYKVPLGMTAPEPQLQRAVLHTSGEEQRSGHPPGGTAIVRL